MLKKIISPTADKFDSFSIQLWLITQSHITNSFVIGAFYFVFSLFRKEILFINFSSRTECTLMLHAFLLVNTFKNMHLLCTLNASTSMIVLSVTLYIFALHPTGLVTLCGLWPWLQLDFTVDGINCLCLL